MFMPDSFAKICKMVRTSTSWKSKETRAPLNDLLVLALDKPAIAISVFCEISNDMRLPDERLLKSQPPLVRMVNWVSLPIRRITMLRTGVLKSLTSKLRCACTGKG